MNRLCLTGTGSAPVPVTRGQLDGINTPSMM